MTQSPIIGRRAVYTQVNRKWDEKAAGFVEIDRKLFHGTIVWVGTTGSSNYPTVIMLYDGGSLCEHSISMVTLEGESPEGALR